MYQLDCHVLMTLMTTYECHLVFFQKALKKEPAVILWIINLWCPFLCCISSVYIYNKGTDAKRCQIVYLERTQEYCGDLSILRLIWTTVFWKVLTDVWILESFSPRLWSWNKNDWLFGWIDVFWCVWLSQNTCTMYHLLWFTLLLPQLFFRVYSGSTQGGGQGIHLCGCHLHTYYPSSSCRPTPSYHAQCMRNKDINIMRTWYALTRMRLKCALLICIWVLGQVRGRKCCIKSRPFTIYILLLTELTAVFGAGRDHSSELFHVFQLAIKFYSNRL